MATFLLKQFSIFSYNLAFSLGEVLFPESVALSPSQNKIPETLPLPQVPAVARLCHLEGGVPTRHFSPGPVEPWDGPRGGCGHHAAAGTISVAGVGWPLCVKMAQRS